MHKFNSSKFKTHPNRKKKTENVSIKMCGNREVCLFFLCTANRFDDFKLKSIVNELLNDARTDQIKNGAAAANGTERENRIGLIGIDSSANCSTKIKII